jgi:hypothetical protein
LCDEGLVGGIVAFSLGAALWRKAVASARAESMPTPVGENVPRSVGEKLKAGSWKAGLNAGAVGARKVE